MKLWKFGAVSFCLALAACGSQIDDRQTEVNQGLVYKHGDNDPFSGTVIHAKRSLVMSNVELDCNVDYEKGIAEGETTCFTSQGTKVFDGATVDEKPSGSEKHWDAQTGKLIYQASWDAAGKDGEEREWSRDGSMLTDRHWKDGKKSGSERTVNGQVVTESSYDDGRLDGLKKVSSPSGTIEETNYDHGYLSGKQTFYKYGQPEVVRQWSKSSMLGESIIRRADKTTIFETDEIKCPDGDCRPTFGVAYDLVAIEMSNQANEQVEFPDKKPRTYDSVDQADQNSIASGFEALKSAAPELIASPTANAPGPDFSKVAKIQTTLVENRPTGVQRAWDTGGAVVLEAQWKEGHLLEAKGSIWPVASTGSTVATDSTAGTTVEVPTSQANDSSVALLTNSTRAGNPSTTQIVIFQFDGANGPEPAFCEDDGQDGVMCRSDSTTEIGAGTYQKFMIPGSKICIAGSAGCVLPKSFDPAVVKG